MVVVVVLKAAAGLPSRLAQRAGEKRHGDAMLVLA
jgi:hypothetical protein